MNYDLDLIVFIKCSGPNVREDNLSDTIISFADNFIAGETYNIATNERHTIEKLAQLILKYTKADESLVTYEERHEILTTKHKKVDNTKSVEVLNHASSTSLEEGVEKTVEWMKKYYNL